MAKSLLALSEDPDEHLRGDAMGRVYSPTPISTPLLDSLITPETLAARLETTTRTLSEWRITGRGPNYIRAGRRVFYRPESVDEWLLGQEHTSTSEELS